MATAPLLLLIVAAAAPCTGPSAKGVCAVVRPVAAVSQVQIRLASPIRADSDSDDTVTPHAALPAKRVAKPVRSPVVAVWAAFVPDCVDSPVLAERTEPGDARGPPAA